MPTKSKSSQKRASQKKVATRSASQALTEKVAHSAKQGNDKIKKGAPLPESHEEEAEEEVEAEDMGAANRTKMDRLFRELSAQETSDDNDHSDDSENGREPKEITLDELSEAELEEDVVPQQRITINNKNALIQMCSDLDLNLPWIETQAITSSEPATIKDVNNDLERELAFYKQALEAAKEGRARIIEAGAPFSRPDDYFAEMVKSDEHMTKLRQRLLDESQRIKAGEEARRQRELKKFGKQVQTEKIQERQKQKTQDLEKIKAMKKKRKGIEDTNVDDDFDIALDEAIADDRPNSKRQKTGASNKKRVNKDAKFGFGGKKRFSKSNTAESSADASGFNPKKMKGGWGAPSRSKKKVVKTRPGKARRQSTRNKKKSG